MSTNRRDSTFRNDNSNDIPSTLKKKIKSIESNYDKLDILEGIPTIDGMVVSTEQILVNRKVKKVRKVYMNNHLYKTGWVVDADINECMICSNVYSRIFMRYRHHCRSCGHIVCSSCSPYKTAVPNLPENGGSRVCVNCFGLKADSTNLYITNNTNLLSSSEVIVPRDRSSTVSRRMIYSPTQQESKDLLSQLDLFEAQQLPKYKDCYIYMRRIVPPDICQTSLPKMIAEGLPEDIATRIWNVKILHLICTNKEDIKKIHIADLRIKYENRGLDLFEMRAIWYNLPEWDPSNPIELPKAEWKESFKSKLDDMAYKDSKEMLSPDECRHSVYKNSENLNVYDPTIEIKSKFIYSAKINLTDDFNDSKSKAVISVDTLIHRYNESNVQLIRKGSKFNKLDNLSSLPSTPKKSNINDFHEDEVIYKDYYSPFNNDSDHENENKIDDDDNDGNSDKIIQAIHAVRKQFSISNNDIETIDNDISTDKNIRKLDSMTPMTLMLKSLQQYNRQESFDATNITSEDNSSSPYKLSPTKLESFSSPIDSLSTYPAKMSGDDEEEEDDDDEDDFFGGEAIATLSRHQSNTSNTQSHDSSNEALLVNLSEDEIENQLIDLVKQGLAAKIRQMNRIKFVKVLDIDIATELLHYCCIYLSNLIEPLGTFVYLLDVCKADINDINLSTNLTPLSQLATYLSDAINNDVIIEIMKYMYLQCNADILLTNSITYELSSISNCALYITLNSNENWIYYDFIERINSNSNSTLTNEMILLESKNYDKIKLYISCLIIFGYATKANSLLNQFNDLIYYSHDDINYLLVLCKQRGFDKLYESIETFELFDKLGANLDD